MLVEQVQSVELSIIVRFVSVNFATQETLSQDATLYHVSLLEIIEYKFIRVLFALRILYYKYALANGNG